jgi:hypothetical protein
MANESYVCDYCQDSGSLLTQSNGVEIKDPTNGLIVARVHLNCREAWEKKESLESGRGISTFEKLK